jgi:hypothetical protein
MKGDDLFRLENTLARLTPYLRATPFALTGGVAVDYHLLFAKKTPSREHVGDLDLVVGRLEALDPAVTSTFLLAHFHQAGPDMKPMVQLVDPLTRLRVDLFPDSLGAIAHATRVSIGRTELLMLSTRSILEHKMQLVRKSTATRPVDPKHWNDAKALAEIGRIVIPPLRPALAEEPYNTDVESRCTRCERSRAAAFPLAPKPEIFALLGYV